MDAATERRRAELYRRDTQIGDAMDRGAGLSHEDRQRLIRERREVRAELERLHVAAGLF
jgi:hypothetical protein